jgi:hypothetical protein
MLGAITSNWLPTVTVGILALWNVVLAYINKIKSKGFCSPVHFCFAMLIEGMYEYYRIKQSLKEKSLGAFYCGQVFNRFQIRYGMQNDSKRIWNLLLSYTVLKLPTPQRCVVP